MYRDQTPIQWTIILIQAATFPPSAGARSGGLHKLNVHSKARLASEASKLGHPECV